jgi:hypothetical protein
MSVFVCVVGGYVDKYMKIYLFYEKHTILQNVRNIL